MSKPCNIPQAAAPKENLRLPDDVPEVKVQVACIDLSNMVENLRERMSLVRDEDGFE